MPRFFVSRDQIADGIVTVTGEDAHHIARSLRMAAGEHITVCDGQSVAYDCVLERFDDDQMVTARILGESAIGTEPCFRATLYQALPKGDKFDTIIQKAVECGAGEIVPFESEFCVVRTKGDSEERKTQRRARIALEAAKQCGRGVLPTVRGTCSFDEMLNLASKADLPIFCYEGDGTLPLKEHLRRARLSGKLPERPTVSVIVGSEGGFSSREAQLAREAGMLMTGLGSRILRTETASGFVLSCLVYEFEL